QEGEAAAEYYARTFDKWERAVVLGPEARTTAVARVPEKLRDTIRFAHDNIRRFAEVQKATLTDCEIELLP
ncbi:MAG: histidinol dehydrogenase, partial [Maritimibacter sp.]|nr:histidinol dehydrogenase [Maritimibacter sp.]